MEIEMPKEFYDFILGIFLSDKLDLEEVKILLYLYTFSLEICNRCGNDFRHSSHIFEIKDFIRNTGSEIKIIDEPAFRKKIQDLQGKNLTIGGVEITPWLTQFNWIY